ncbi:MAG TPA: YHS domain-containing protein [Thermoanaerobaculia bacterium]|nr:YHS domain-containing protein [Thermoanaerobaculia bacterium]
MNTTDPVCGMTIDPATAAASSTYEGETYHFCARGCQARFDANPEQYTAERHLQ